MPSSLVRKRANQSRPCTLRQYFPQTHCWCHGPIQLPSGNFEVLKHKDPNVGLRQVPNYATFVTPRYSPSIYYVYIHWKTTSYNLEQHSNNLLERNFYTIIETTRTLHLTEYNSQMIGHVVQCIQIHLHYFMTIMIHMLRRKVGVVVPRFLLC